MTICKGLNCIKNASYNFENEKARFCKTHKTDNMINVRNKKSEYSNCTYTECVIKNAVFNLPNESKGKFCKKHKTDDMIDVKNERCEYLKCKIRPNYNFEGETKGKFCNKHKEDCMVDVNNIKCKYPKCTSQPNFNVEGQTIGIYCSKHKADDMVYTSKRCEYPECKSISPIFNIKGQTKGIYCGTHKRDGMVDVKNPKCQKPECESQPSFNVKGETTGIFCGIHKTNDMIDVVHSRCKHINCESLNPCFNIKDQLKGEYCFTHKTNNMIDIKNPRCVSCDLFRVIKKGELCPYCNPESTIRQKTKEMQIKKLLEKYNIKFIHNKGVSNDCCFRYRPDFVIECTTNDNIHYIVLEVDEFAHKDYDPECEVTRMNNISVSLNLPTKFLRYNPDLKGIYKKIKEKTLITRLKELMNNFDNDLTVEYLFYP